jgi:hypothetical protein
MGRVRGLIVRAAVLLLAVCVPAAGCANACPAIGWINSVTVELAGDVSRVATVQLCVAGGCSELSPEPGTAAPRIVETMPLGPTAPVTYGAAPSMAPFYAEQIDARTWRFTVNMSSPDRVTAKALTAGGEVLIAKETDLEWKRVGGSAQCGGPSDVPPIKLTVPNGESGPA